MFLSLLGYHTSSWYLANIFVYIFHGLELDLVEQWFVMRQLLVIDSVFHTFSWRWNEDSSVECLCVVRQAHNTIGSCLTHLLWALSRRFFNMLNSMLLVASAYPLPWGDKEWRSCAWFWKLNRCSDVIKIELLAIIWDNHIRQAESAYVVFLNESIHIFCCNNGKSSYFNLLWK